MTLASDVERLTQSVAQLTSLEENTAKLAAAHEQQISGDRGISDTLVTLAEEIRSLRRAAYWVAGIIVAGSITFAFSALTLLGH